MTRSRRSWAGSTACTRFREAAEASGMELAMDIAIQASPDHPWVREHPELVPARPGRHHQVRREPAEEVPGHLPDRVRQRRSGGARCPVARLARRLPDLDRSRHPDLPGRQPAHQADRLLAVADRRGPARAPRRDLPLRGLHPPQDDAHAGQGRLHPELHLLHLARDARRAARLLHRADPERDARLLPRQPVHQHAGHQPAPPRPRAAGVRDPDRAGHDPLARRTGSTPAGSCARTSGWAIARSTSTARSTRSAPATGTRPATSRT